MGTRADFYVGKGRNAEWLGSIAWDGYREGIPRAILEADQEDDYRKLVSFFLATRRDATTPDQGWPWPWNDSALTDCSYWFFDGACWDEQNRRYCRAGQEISEEPNGEYIEFPDMSRIKNVTFGDRSGVMFFSAG